MEIVVVGAGFAGVWAAAGAVRTAAELGREEDVTVTVVAPGEDMVIRPRLYEDDPSRMRVALDRVLGPIGVRRVRAEITGVDVDAHRVTGRDHDGNPVELAYDKLVLATGSTLVSPQLPGAEHLFDVDTIEAADALHQHIAQLSQDPQRPGAFAAVVVGGAASPAWRSPPSCPAACEQWPASTRCGWSCWIAPTSWAAPWATDRAQRSRPHWRPRAWRSGWAPGWSR